MGKTCGTHGEKNIRRILVGKSELKRLLVRTRSKQEDNIKGDLK
jgi:hypothetical protein